MVGSICVRRHISAALVASVALTLAACADSRVPAPGTAAQAPVADMAPQPSVAALPRVPDPAPNAPAPMEAQRLIGLKGDLLRGWIGNTVFVRRDGIAEIWRFAADSCFLDVFLYREGDGLRVAHLDARPRIGTARISPQSCYGSILTERKGLPPS